MTHTEAIALVLIGGWFAYLGNQALHLLGDLLRRERQRRDYERLA